MENLVKMEQLYEGKAKKVFATSNPDYVIVDYKDDATAFNGIKKGTITGKGVINNKMTNNSAGVKPLPIRLTSFCGLIDNHKVSKKKPAKNKVSPKPVSPKNGRTAIS